MGDPMTDFAFPAPPVVSVAIEGQSVRFPVRRVFCVGRNYADHVAEMAGDLREPPFFFTKPADALVPDGATIPYPPATADLHHEAEVVVAIGTAGADIPVDRALDHVWGYAAGNDLTRRDLQAEAKAMRRPWDMGKGFDASAVIGAIVPVAVIGHPTAGRITCTLDGEVRQDGDISQMIWSIPEVIAALSRLVTLAPGDLIYTGTPAGVGAIVRGQTCAVTVAGLGTASVTVA